MLLMQEVCQRRVGQSYISSDLLGAPIGALGSGVWAWRHPHQFFQSYEFSTNFIKNPANTLIWCGWGVILIIGELFFGINL